MRGIDRKFVVYGLKAILQPVAKYCLRHSLKFQDIIECLKGVYIKSAREELESTFQEITHSRLSVMTGLHRRDVMKYGAVVSQSDQGKSLISKVIGQWRTNRRYVSKQGVPKVLSLGWHSEFAELVRTVSRDLNPTTVLFELERVGTVERTGDGVKLKLENYIPKGDVVTGFNILASDLDDLTSGVEENLFESPALPNLHLRTEFDRVRADSEEKIKVWLLKEGQEFHARARDFVSKFDQDVKPDPNYTGKFIKVVLGGFSKVINGGKR